MGVLMTGWSARCAHIRAALSLPALGGAVAVVLWAAAIAVPGAAIAAGSPTPAPTSSMLEVSVPFSGTTSQAFPEGWSARECPAGGSPNLITVHCDNDRVEFTANGYLATQEPQSVTIVLTNAGARQSLTYRVALAAPTLEVSGDTRYGIPLTQGTPTTIPYSDLQVRCQACTTTLAEFRSPTVEPSDAGALRFTATGLEFRPAPDFSGTATVGFTVLDGTGQESAPASLALSVPPGTSSAPTTVTDLVRVSAGATATGNALDNDIRQPDDTSTLVSCGLAGNGIARCSADGRFEYTPNPGFTGVDQFSYRLFSTATGDNAVGSVLVGVGADPAPVAAIAAGSDVQPGIAQPGITTPPEGSMGSFTLFREVMDRALGPLH